MGERGRVAGSDRGRRRGTGGPPLPRPPAVIAALLVAIGANREITWRAFSATNEEGTHLAAGVGLYKIHTATLQSENPPLPRVILSAAPWFGGMRYDPRGSFTDQIHSVFYDHGDYRANLFRGCAGTAVFFIIAAIAVFFAARDALGDTGALAATFLFTMEPVVLGYSALATHDGPAVAGLAVALLAFGRWLRMPYLEGTRSSSAPRSASASTASSPASSTCR